MRYLVFLPSRRLNVPFPHENGYDGIRVHFSKTNLFRGSHSNKNDEYRVEKQESVVEPLDP